jgi:very-short-patch-repair endonuclease
MRHRSHLSFLRSPKVAASAKTLRANMTDAERKLWYYLRAHRFEGLGFRRQVPVGPYVADFLCEELRVIVEVDGGQHSERSHEDEERTAWLNARGYRVIRFWNNDVMGNMEGVWEALSGELRKILALRA